MPHPTEPYYTPPDFPVYEFDDSRLSAVERSDATRWLSGCNGRIGYPAQDVQLSWRAPRAAQALVATRRAHEGESSLRLRFNAVVVLDNAQFYDPGPPLRPPLTRKEDVELYAGDSALHPGLAAQGRRRAGGDRGPAGIQRPRSPILTGGSSTPWRSEAV